MARVATSELPREAAQVNDNDWFLVDQPGVVNPVTEQMGDTRKISPDILALGMTQRPAMIDFIDEKVQAETDRAVAVEGGLANLETDDKTNLVSAVNEVSGIAEYARDTADEAKDTLPLKADKIITPLTKTLAEADVGDVTGRIIFDTSQPPLPAAAAGYIIYNDAAGITAGGRFDITASGDMTWTDGLGAVTEIITAGAWITGVIDTGDAVIADESNANSGAWTRGIWIAGHTEINLSDVKQLADDARLTANAAAAVAAAALPRVDVVDDLTTGGTAKALSAEQGKTLGEGLTNLIGDTTSHIGDTANPHGVTLQQAATAQSTNNTTIPGRIFHGGISEGNKYLTAAEIASLYRSGVNYKGKLKYGAMTLADMIGIAAAADNHGLSDGDYCGVQETQLSYRYTSAFTTTPENMVPGSGGTDGAGYTFSGLHSDEYTYDIVNGELSNVVCATPASTDGMEHYEITDNGLSGASFDGVTSRSSSWDASPQGQDQIGDMYLIEYWYGGYDGQTYAGEVQAQIICQEITPDVVFDLYLDTTILLDDSVTDDKIGERTLVDESGDPTLDPTTPRTVTGWFQKIYNHLKALFSGKEDFLGNFDPGYGVYDWYLTAQFNAQRAPSYRQNAWKRLPAFMSNIKLTTNTIAPNDWRYWIINSGAGSTQLPMLGFAYFETAATGNKPAFLDGGTKFLVIYITRETYGTGGRDHRGYGRVIDVSDNTLGKWIEFISDSGGPAVTWLATSDERVSTVTPAVLKKIGYYATETDALAASAVPDVLCFYPED